MMFKSSTQHWSIRKRLYIVALVAGFCVVQSIAVNFFLIKKYNYTVEHISQGELLKLDNITHIFKDLSDTHTQLFSLLRKAGKGKSEQAIYLLGGQLIDRMDALHLSIKKINKTVLSKQGKFYEFDSATLDNELKNYRNAASIAIEMFTVNFNLSEKYLLKATVSFNKLNNLLSGIMSETTEHASHEMQEELQLINSIYWPLSIIVVLIAIFMAPLIYRILRDLSENFSWIERSLNMLRKGNTEIDLPTEFSDTEMGKISRSLDRFRAALIKVRDSQTALAEKNRLLIEESERRLLTEKELRRTLVELSRATVAVETSNHAKSLFLANMSHEIRTPLNAVLGMAQVLQTTELDNSQEDYVDTLYTQGHHLLQLLNSILDYSKMESGNFKLEYTTFKLDNLLDEVTSLYKNQPSQNELVLTLDIDPDIDKHLYGDPLRIRQILINLLSNAYKFTRQGEIKIHIESYSQKLACHEIRPANCPNKRSSGQCDWLPLYITVSDTGIGIDQDKQQYIFENFTQADESFTRKYGGTGIGLAICKQLVELMGGEIGVNSEPGQGATFWFRICLPDQNSLEQQQVG